MSLQELEKAVLSKLYEAYFNSHHKLDYNDLREQVRGDEESFRKLVGKLIYDKLIRDFETDEKLKMTHLGIEHVEELKIGPEELIRTNENVRFFLLEILAEVFEKEGSASFVHYKDLAKRVGFDSNLVWANLELLSFGGGIDNQGIDLIYFRISRFGLQRVASYRSQIEIIDEFERLSEMQPQPRGLALEKLLAKVLGYQGWPQLRGVRNESEEIDIIVYRAHEYYFIECKWEKNPIEAEVVHKLIGKLTTRVDVKGMVVSMSGFSKGAVQSVRDHANTRVVLLFGPEDLRSIIFGQVGFDKLLDEKYREFVTRKKVLYR